jgi:hypothetical protein
MSYTYTDLETALDAVDVSLKETLLDNPALKSQEDSVYWDLCQAIQYECDPATAAELARVTGVDPVRGL